MHYQSTNITCYTHEYTIITKQKDHNRQDQQKYANQLQQSDKARHKKHTPIHNIIYANAKYSAFTEQYDQCGDSTE